MDTHTELAEQKVWQPAKTWRRWGLSLFPWVQSVWGERDMARIQLWIPNCGSPGSKGSQSHAIVDIHPTPHTWRKTTQPSSCPHDTRGCCQGPPGAAGQLGATRLSKETMVHPGASHHQPASLTESQSPHQLSGDNSTCSASPLPPGLL